MLDERPILQKSLIGAGAFAFVFFAAMGGTAFMISGGFDLSNEHPGPRNPSEVVTVVQDTWSDWAVPASEAAPVQEARVIPASADTSAIDSDYPEALEGADAQVTGRDRTEEQVARDIRREYDAATADQQRDVAQADDDVWAEDDPAPVKGDNSSY